MSPRFAVRLRDRRLLLVVAVGALSVGAVAIISRHSDQVVPHRTDPAASVDPRFPIPFDQRFPAEAQSAPDSFGDPLGRAQASGPAPVTSTNPRTLRRVMDLGVAQYATATDDSAKTKGASMVLAAGLLGFQPARELVIRNYPRSPAVRRAVPIQDVVRFAVDLLVAVATPGEGDAEPAIALGNYFVRRGEVLSFAEHLVGAISDDRRAQTEEQIARLFSVFVRVPGVCTGIKRAISQDRRIDQNECSDGLGADLLRTARSRRPTGMEVEGRNRGLQMLKGLDTDK